MKLLLLLSSFLVGNFSTAQTGTLSGNVFYKYNQLIGDKGDAGSFVYVIKNKTVKYDATCDVGGNFKIDNIDTGYYDIVVISKATNNDPEGSLMDFTTMAAFLKLKVDNQLEDSIRNTKRLYDSLNNPLLKMKTYTGKPKEIKKAEDYNKTIDDLKSATYSKYVKQLNQYYDYTDNNNEMLNKIVFIPFPVQKKIYTTFIKIENGKTKNIVVDFGVSYN